MGVCARATWGNLATEPGTGGMSSTDVARLRGRFGVNGVERAGRDSELELEPEIAIVVAVVVSVVEVAVPAGRVEDLKSNNRPQVRTCRVQEAA